MPEIRAVVARGLIRKLPPKRLWCSRHVAGSLDVKVLAAPPKKNIYLKVFPNDTIKRWWSSSCTSFGTRYLFPLIWNFIDINYISLLRHAGLGQEKIKILRFKNDLVSQQIVEEPEEPANFLFYFFIFFHGTLFKTFSVYPFILPCLLAFPPRCCLPWPPPASLLLCFHTLRPAGTEGGRGRGRC